MALNDTSPGNKSRQSTPSVHWGTSNNLYGTIDDADTSSNEKDDDDQDDGVGSEDSDAKRIAKTTSIQMGRMTFKVVGKTALRDDLQKGIAIYGRFISTLGGVWPYGYGHQHHCRDISPWDG